ncbi:DUF6236 family protein [Sphingomonas mali]|uniref:DUF6236 family protein n=1 Tax=Sphingomonas mali TaxID=40682 RepID=UPI000A42B6B6
MLPKGAMFDLRTGQWTVPAPPAQGSFGTAPNGRYLVRGGSLSIGPGEGTSLVDIGTTLTRGQRGAVVQYGQRWEGGADYLAALDTVADDSSVMRAALLFADVVDWPQSNLWRSPDDDLLVSALGGNLVRSHFAIQGQIVAERMSELPYAAFKEHEVREPGMWSIWHADRDSPVPDEEASSELGFRLTIQKALLLPANDVPFEDVLAFRHRHHDKLVALRQHIDEVAQDLRRHGWDSQDTRLAIERFDASLAHYLEAARQSNTRKVLANLSVSSNWLGSALSFAGTATASLLAGLPLSGAVLAGAATGGACLSVAGAPGLKSRTADGPFAYLVQIEREWP